MSKQSEFHSLNRKKLKQLAKEQGANTIAIAGNGALQSSADRALPFEQDGSFYYLTGIEEPDGILVITENDEFISFPSRSVSRQAFEGEVDQSEINNISGIQNIRPEDEIWDIIAACKGSIGVLRPAGNYIPEAGFYINPARQRVLDSIGEKEFIDLRKNLADLRTIKSEYEIDLTKKAIKHTVELFEALRNVNAENESDLLAKTAEVTAKRQLKYAYEPIIASGRNACTLHYVKNNSVIDRKNLLLLDIGLKYQGYSADITRTFVPGEPSKRQQEVYDAVLEVQEYAISILKPGVRLKDYESQVLEQMGNQLIKLGLINEPSKENIRKYYPHSTSHFLGIDVHDAGNYENPIEAGVILTVEPGIYIPEESIGIRIEDDILITESGNEVLSAELPKNVASLTIKS